jgi:uroporphyrinogen-III synthase
MTTEQNKPVIAIMRPERYLSESVELARSMGFDPVAIPMAELSNIKDSVFDGFFTRVIQGDTDCVIIAGPAEIEYVLKKIPHPMRPQFIETLNNRYIVAVNPETKEALHKEGVKTGGMPDICNTEEIAAYMQDYADEAIIDVVYGAPGSNAFTDHLQDFGATVYETRVYNLIDPDREEQEEFIRTVMQGDIDIFAFTDPTSVHNFFDHAKRQGLEKDVAHVLNNSIVAAIGEATTYTLKLYRVKAGVTPENFTFEELLKASMKAYTDTKLKS